MNLYQYMCEETRRKIPGPLPGTTTGARENNQFSQPLTPVGEMDAGVRRTTREVVEQDHVELV